MTTSLDEVLDLFKQVTQARKETEMRFQETDRLQREQSLESNRRFRETERTLQKFVEENKKGFKQLRKKSVN